METYINTESCGEDVPKRIKDFSIRYYSTDGWRGYYEAIPTKKSKWQEIESSWATTGDWSDAGKHSSSVVKQNLDELYNKMISENKEMIVVCAPTTNVFSTGYQVFVR